MPGIRPGQPTQDYLSRVILRLTWGGALFLGFVAIVPYLASLIVDVQSALLPSFSLLIMVGVALDTLRQLEAQLMMRNYEGIPKVETYGDFSWGNGACDADNTPWPSWCWERHPGQNIGQEPRCRPYSHQETFSVTISKRAPP